MTPLKSSDWQDIYQDEIELAEKVARIQQDSAEKLKLKNPYQNFPDHYVANRIGCIGELFAARILGCEWQSQHTTGYNMKERRNLTDLSHNIEVRTTHYPRGFLPVKKDDYHPNSRMVLCILYEQRRVARLAGWIVQKDAIDEKYWKTTLPQPCYAVPQQALRFMQELELIIDVENEYHMKG